MLSKDIHRPNFVKYCTGDAENKQDEEQHKDLRVGELVYCRPLQINEENLSYSTTKTAFSQSLEFRLKCSDNTQTVLM
jgi:hypothetical protein